MDSQESVRKKLSVGKKPEEPEEPANLPSNDLPKWDSAELREQYILPDHSPIMTLKAKVPLPGLSPDELAVLALSWDGYIAERGYVSWQWQLLPYALEGAGLSVDGQSMVEGKGYVLRIRLDNETWLEKKVKILSQTQQAILLAQLCEAKDTWIQTTNSFLHEHRTPVKAIVNRENDRCCLNKNCAREHGTKWHPPRALYKCAENIQDEKTCPTSFAPQLYISHFSDLLPVSSDETCPYKYHALSAYLGIREILLIPGPKEFGKGDPSEHHCTNSALEKDPLFWESLNALVTSINKITGMSTTEWLERVYINHGQWESVNTRFNLVNDDCHAHAHLTILGDAIQPLSEFPELAFLKNRTADPAIYFIKDMNELCKTK